MDNLISQRKYLKSLYFFVFLATGFVTPFATVFYKHTLVNPDGTTADHLIGWIYFFMPLMGILANVPTGILADKLELGRHLITFFCFAVAVFTTLVGLSGSDLTASLSLEARFLWVFAAVMGYYIFSMPMVPTVDGETMTFLNKIGQRDSYGAVRVWGTLGWSIACIIMGLVLNHYYHLPLIFYSSSVAFLLLGVVSLRGLNFKRRASAVTIPWAHLKKDRLFVWFLVFSFLNGIMFAASFLYTSYFFDDVLETPFEMGLVFGTWTIFEIPIMFFSKPLIKKLGNRWLIVAGLLLNGIRLVLFSLFTLETPFFLKWAAATLQGAAFGMLHLGTIDFIDHQSHDNMKATYMNIGSLARITLASAVGGKMGAWIIASYGADSLMLVTGLGSLILILFFGVFVRGHGPTDRPGN
ncbi:MAG: MFS transporter [Deltaproteobacteria bacterium]|nr:MFS transporter [Deltaproteobacteria bacterium]MBN2671410.1 MFS transporter [Deltaproteobacteria bacterium]